MYYWTSTQNLSITHRGYRWCIISGSQRIPAARARFLSCARALSSLSLALYSPSAHISKWHIPGHRMLQRYGKAEVQQWQFEFWNEPNGMTPFSKNKKRQCWGSYCFNNSLWLVEINLSNPAILFGVLCLKRHGCAVLEKTPVYHTRLKHQGVCHTRLVQPISDFTRWHILVLQ